MKVERDSLSKNTIVTANGVPDYIPGKKGIVRVPMSKSKWIIRPITESSVSVEYTMLIDPGGSVPLWMVNMVAEEAPYKSFRDLKKMVETNHFFVLIGSLLLSLFHAVQADNPRFIFSMVSPGIPDVRIQDTNILNPTVRNILSTNGARQQYYLGVTLLQKYPFLNKSEILAVSEPSNRCTVSSQACLRGVLSNSKGPTIKIINVDIVNPPAKANDAQTGNWTLPKDELLNEPQSYLMREMNYMASFDAYCQMAAEDIDKSMRFFESSSGDTLKLLKAKFGKPENGTFSSFGNLYRGVIGYNLTYGTQKTYYNTIMNQSRILSAGAMLEYVGNVHSDNVHLNRLMTKDIVSELTNHYQNGNLKQNLAYGAQIIHVNEMIFSKIMALIGLTNRECLKKIIDESYSEVDDGRCELFPPFSSIITFEFSYEGEDTKNTVVRAYYNGEQFKIKDNQVLSDSDFLKQITSELSTSHGDYYCIPEGSETSNLTDFILLCLMFGSIIVLMTSIATYLISKTQIKTQQLELVYKQKHLIFNLPGISEESSHTEKTEHHLNGSIL